MGAVRAVVRSEAVAAMSDHADTIRRFIQRHTASLGMADALDALDALLAERQEERDNALALWRETETLRAERQQAQEERDAALAKLTPSAVRVYAEVEQLKAERQQAIEALREIAIDGSPEHRWVRIARDALVEQP